MEITQEDSPPTAPLDDFTDAELAAIVAAENVIPSDVEGVDTPLTLPEPPTTPIPPGFAGRHIERLGHELISMKHKRAAVRYGMPQSATYPEGTWIKIDDRAISLLQDPAFMVKAEDRLRGFHRLFSEETAAAVVIGWAYWKATVEVLGL